MGATLRSGLFVLLAVFFTAQSASAIPLLQLYAEGATYDSTTESWVISNWSGAAPITIWAIANISGPGGKGTISNVRMSVAYSSSYNPNITLTPTTATASYGMLDTSVPTGTGGTTGVGVGTADGGWIQTVSDGSVPTLSDGSSLPSHGEYGAGVTWQEFGIGDFVTADSLIGDFINSFPGTLVSGGRINAYQLSLNSGLADGLTLHIDLYDSIQTGRKTQAKFAPFSHDGTANVPPPPPPPPLPEPATILSLGIGILGLVGAASRKRLG